MKFFIITLFSLNVLFSNCDTKSVAAEKTAETKPSPVETIPATSVTTATTNTKTKTIAAASARTNLPTFAVKYVGGKGFFVNNKFIGDIATDKAVNVLADAMTVYTKQGGIVPNNLQLEIIHDTKTDVPLMGQTGDLREAFKQAIMIFNKRPPIENAKATTCYIKVENKVDTTFCSLTIIGNVVTGNYNWVPWQKDGAIGNFKGKLKGNIISGIYDYTIEGSQQKDEKVFMLDKGVLKEGVAEHSDPKADGISYFRDKSKIKFTSPFKTIDCGKFAH